MHTDARNLDNGTTLTGDICIIGAGAAGISIALEFMNSNYDVVLLEGGGFEYEDRIQELYDGKTTGQPYYPMKSSELHYFGGTTGHWGGMCAVFDPITFQKRDWVNDSGWPINQDTLLPYYKRAASNVDIDSNNFDLEFWLKQDPDFIPLPLDEQVVWNKIWKFSKPTRFGIKYREQIVNAKNIHLYTYANVVDITCTENLQNVKTVTIKKFTAKAKYFILACAGIQNPRILLAANKQANKGLGNEHDLVGRFFMENAEFKSAELWLNQKSELNLYMNLQPRVRAELAIMPEKQAEFKILNGMVSFTPLDYAKQMPSYIQLWNTSDPRINEEQTRKAMYKTAGSRIHRLFEKFKSSESKKKHQAFQMTLRLEQSPNPLSRVTLGNQKDELGVPQANLNWAFTPLEKKSLRKIYEIIGQQAGEAGIGRVRLMEELWDPSDETLPVTTSGGWHHMGTTRMSDDPKKGVVDADCKLHGMQNLFIAGSSCFTTGSAVNPTFTIVALSIRLADHVKHLLSISNNI
jgi:choline dehydrogenase-like flavoprotein